MGADRANIAYYLKNQIEGDDRERVGDIREIEISLTSVQLKAMNTVPTELVEAPGPNKIIEFVSAVLFLDYGTVAYVGGGNIAIRTTGAATRTDVSNIFGSDVSMQLAYDTYTMITAKHAAIMLAADVDEGLELRCSADHTAGDGTARIKVMYRILDFS